MVKKMLEVVVKYLYPAFTKVKILAFTVYSGLSRVCRALVPSGASVPPPGVSPGTRCWFLTAAMRIFIHRDTHACYCTQGLIPAQNLSIKRGETGR